MGSPQKGRSSFSEEKEAKRLCSIRTEPGGACDLPSGGAGTRHGLPGAKVFWFFFSKENRLPSSRPSSCRHRRLPLRRDQLITIGCLNVAVGLALAGVIALVPTLPYALIAVPVATARFPAMASAVLARASDRLARLVAAGELDPHVTEVLPLDEAARALALVEDGHAEGKVVLVPS